MKKSLLALAALSALAASAQAQSTVQLVGVIDEGYKSVIHTDTTKNLKALANNNTAISQFNFKGTQTVSGTTKASFFFELDVNPGVSSTLNQGTSNQGQVYSGTPFNGQQFISLTGDFGDLKLGTPNSPGLVAGLTAQPFGTALGSAFSSGFGRLGTTDQSGVNQYVGGPSSKGRIIRHEKTAVYSSPNLNGVTAQLEYSFKNANSTTATANDNGLLGVALSYNQGPINAIYYHGKASAGANAAAGTAATLGSVTAGPLTANASVTWNMLAANYKFGDATVYGGYTTTKTSDATVEDASSWNLAGKYTMGSYD